jgi:uncharacterized protein (DUF433 family)
MSSIIDAYVQWDAKLERNPDILGGEAVFPGTRSSVFRVGRLRETYTLQQVKEEYPHLQEVDILMAEYWIKIPSDALMKERSPNWKEYDQCFHAWRQQSYEPGYTDEVEEELLGKLDVAWYALSIEEREEARWHHCMAGIQLGEGKVTDTGN